MLQFYFYSPRFFYIEAHDKPSIIRHLIKNNFLWISFAAEVVSFSFISIAFHFQSKYDFKNHKIGNLTDYFYYLPNTTASINDESFYNNSISFQYNCSIEQKILRFANISKSNNSYFRKLVSRSFCQEIYSSFIKYKGRPLSNIFNLNIETLFGISIPLIVIYSIFEFVAFFSLIISNFIFIKKIIEKKRENKIENKREKKEMSCCEKLQAILYNKLIRCIMIFLNIAKYVLFIIFIYFFEKGDIEKYENFLECSNVRKKFFSKLFIDVENLRKNYTFYWIFTIISEGIDKLEQLIEIICFPNEDKNNNNSIDNTNNQSLNKIPTETSININN